MYSQIFSRIFRYIRLFPDTRLSHAVFSPYSNQRDPMMIDKMRTYICNSRCQYSVYLSKRRNLHVTASANHEYSQHAKNGTMGVDQHSYPIKLVQSELAELVENIHAELDKEVASSSELSSIARYVSSGLKKSYY